MIPFSELIELNPRESTVEGVVPYVGMGDVSNGGQLLAIRERPVAELAPGQPCFRDDDVLFAKITPCMENGKGAYVEGLSGEVARGSTEFHVLRAKEGVSSRFIYQWTRCEDFRRRAESMMTGSAGQRRVPASFFRGYWVRHQTLEEQLRIAEALDSVDQEISHENLAIRKLCTVRDGVFSMKLDELYASCDLVSMQQAAVVERGRFSARPRNDPAFYGGRHPFIQTGDVVAAGGGVVHEASQHLNDAGLSVSRIFPAGTVAVTIAANIGDTALLGVEMCFPDSVVGIIARDGYEPRFLERCVSRARPSLEAEAPQSAQRNINLQDLRPLAVPDAETAVQREFVRLWDSYAELQARRYQRIVKLRRIKAAMVGDLLHGRMQV
jgi:type I restriction enzyme S subunit